MAKCRICGDEQANMHYGSVSCNGCRGFFRRSVAQKRVYRCQFDNKCAIIKAYRNRCRACRLKQCFAMGMNTTTIKCERKKEINNQQMPNLSTSSSSSITTVSVMQRSTSISSVPRPRNDTIYNNQPSYFIHFLQSKQRFDDDKLNHHHSPVLSYLRALEKFCDSRVIVRSEFDADESENESLCTFSLPLEQAFKQPALVCKRLPIVWTAKEYLRASEVQLMWCRTFVYCVDWAVNLPEYQQLSEADQSALLTNGCHIIAWWTHAYNTMLSGCDGITVLIGRYFPRDTHLHSSIDEPCVQFFNNILHLFIDGVVKPLRSIDFDENEYCLMKAIIFFEDASNISIAGRELVKSARKKYMNELCEYVRNKNTAQSSFVLTQRIANVLMVLPKMHQICQQFNENIQLMALIGSIGMQLPYEYHSRQPI